MLDLLGRSTAISHEDVFMRRYDALLGVALRVTDGDRQEAEDLVHEAFIRFTLVQPPLDEVLHLDAYLSRMLRNMYTSRIRRRLRAAETSLSILDYDSLDIGFHALDASTAFEVRETLRAACEYGCIRKRSSKTGSVFLLRFFHGYLPSEIATLARLSPAIVDALIFRARREVKVYVDKPNHLAFIGGREAGAAATLPVTRAPVEAPQSEQAFVQELRARIFTDTHERCCSKKELRERYRPVPGDTLSRDALADLVGCPVCLDAVNALQGWPRLAERWPSDTLGPGSRGGGGGPKGSAPATIASGRRRSQAVFEHRPRELRVSVNGFVMGAHTIGAYDGDLTLNVNLDEPIALIELLSEQDLCFVFLDVVPPPHGLARQRRRVALSDGRWAELEVTFAGPWPTIRASYSDPHRVPEMHVEDILSADTDTVETTQTVFTLDRSRPRWFTLRPASTVAMLIVALVWLLFWTPGTTVSAAERIADTIRWIVSAVFDRPSSSTRAPTAPVPRIVDTPALSLPTPVPAPPPAAALSAERRTYLELKALANLQHVDAYLGQELSLDARNSGPIRVSAVVDTQARRQVLLDALGSLAGDPNLNTRITALDSVTARTPQTRAATATDTQSFQLAPDEFPMFATVRLYLQHREAFQRDGNVSAAPVDASWLDAQARRFATSVLERARRASRHAWAQKHLGDRFPAAVIGEATPETREIWRGLVREHARAYQQELALLRQEMEPMVRVPDASSASPDRDSIAVDGDAWTRIDRLLDAHKRHDEAIQHAFATQTGVDSDVDAVDSAAFWTLFDLCESLAAAIARDPLT